MKFCEWLKRGRENTAKESMQMYVDSFKKPLPYQDLIVGVDFAKVPAEKE